MKTISLMMACFCIGLSSFAQQIQGKVIYSRTMTMQIRLNGNDNEAMQNMLPKSRTDKFELSFANNQSILKHINEEENTGEIEGNGMQIKMVAPGQNDIVFHDFSSGKKTEQREVMDKKFLVSDSISKLNWKFTGETQTLLGHLCQKAMAQRTGKRTVTIMENGNIGRKEINDTTNIIAWFTTDIPVSAGPELQGQLPGLILELDMNNGRLMYRALEIQNAADLASIKAPVKGKKVTAAEFIKERDNMMEQMQRNNQGNGGNRVIRMQN